MEVESVGDGASALRAYDRGGEIAGLKGVDLAEDVRDEGGTAPELP